MKRQKTKEKLMRKSSNLFGLASFSVWIKLVFRNGMNLKYLGTFFSVIIPVFFTIPLRLIDHIFFNKTVRKTKLDVEPIFILGHHRSGTTLLHNLLVQDPLVSHVTTFQAIAPGFAVFGNKVVKGFLRKIVRGKRPMDNVEISVDAAQEEEIGVANMSLHSYYHHFSFPKKRTYYMEKYLLLEDISDTELKERKAAYLFFLQKVTFLSKTKKLVLKNPINTAQIPFLLSLFPNAKFIHIHRNPYDVFPSFVHHGKQTKDAHILQKVSAEEDRAFIFTVYEKMMKKLIKERSLIPVGNFIEISFEDLEKDKLGTVSKIYKALNLPNYELAKPHFEVYIKTLKNYQKNKFSLFKKDIKEINDNWGFAFKEWGYKLKTI